MPMSDLLLLVLIIIIIIIEFHSYSFSLHNQKQVYKDKNDQCGPIHITIGDGGNREGLATR